MHLCKQARGFTLVELLVTLSILGLLAAITLASISGARKKADQLYCQNNLKQWGVAGTMYCADNEDFLPFAYTPSEHLTNNFYFLLFPYLTSTDFSPYTNFEKGITACKARMREEVGIHNPIKMSYGMNQHNSRNAAKGTQETVTLSSVPDPTLTMFMGELAQKHNHPGIFDKETDPTDGIYQLGFRHQNRVNIISMDLSSTKVFGKNSFLLIRFHEDE